MQYQLSQREKYMLFFLAVFAIIMVGYLGLIQPALERRLELTTTLQEELDVKAQMESNIQQLPALEQEREQARVQATSAGAVFYEPLNSNRANELVVSLLDVHLLTPTSMTVSPMTVKDLSSGDVLEISPLGYNWISQIQAAQTASGIQTGTDGEQSSQQATAQVLSTTITMTCQGEFSNFLAFFDDVAKRVPARVTLFSNQEDKYTVALELYMLDPVQ
ncbi:MAG: type II secretion system protein M [Candidatus Fournierella pullistercoris]|uniref:Type II secretion system protein M n=1 Tax=Candidatus Allofournierella pullistercoris TaxID=2838597 RepID=A0A948T1I6_9FIRM|nr:type II secretion system protein M [Candidatus Fournierella pullistercoris]